MLRRSFVLAEQLLSAPARVTADSRFVLFVNGCEIARGPARCAPERLAWVDVDLAPHLHPGGNVIAALVHFYGQPMPWWIPAPPSRQLGYGSFAFTCPAINVRSDRSWRARSYPLRHAAGHSRALHPPAEIVDGRDIPSGWSGPGFEDEEWAHATELRTLISPAGRGTVGSEPFTAMEPADIAPLTATAVELATAGARHVASSDADNPMEAYSVEAAAGDDGSTRYALYDAGRLTVATPWVDIWGDPGAVVDIYAGEDLRADGTLETQPRNYAFRYVVGGGEATEHGEGLDPVGFRYLAVVTRGKADVLSVGATERHYPRSGDAFFACSDERFNRIWEVGARTLDVCSLDAFVDCPGREQRAWVGDAYIHSLVTFVTNDDWRLVRRNLRICAHSKRPDGLLSMVAAGDAGRGALTIPDYSLHWIRALARYWERSGDGDTVAELLPVAIEIAASFERYRGASGLLEELPGWVFVDWAQTERGQITGAVDALHAAALEDLAAMLRAVTGDEFGADREARRAQQTRAAFEVLWDERRGAYVDAADIVAGAPLRGRRISQQTNAMAIVAGCAPPDRLDRIIQYVLDPDRLVVTATPADRPRTTPWAVQQEDPRADGAFDPEENVVAAQPFFSHFVHQAVVAAGYEELIPSLCVRWWDQIERGNSTLEEYWTAEPGTASRAHAWSATPTYDLTTHVLGVRPTEIGFGRATVQPVLGPMQYLAGRVPTPYGSLTVEVTTDEMKLDVPLGLTVDVGGRQLRAGQHTVSTPPGPAA